MHRIEVNVETGEQQEIELTAEEIAESESAYKASQKLTSWEMIRTKRDQLIKDSDWTMIPDATVNQASWAQYRQILRDLPQTYAKTGPESVVWPEPPSTAGPNVEEE